MNRIKLLSFVSAALIFICLSMKMLAGEQHSTDTIPFYKFPVSETKIGYLAFQDAIGDDINEIMKRNWSIELLPDTMYFKEIYPDKTPELEHETPEKKPRSTKHYNPKLNTKFDPLTFLPNNSTLRKIHQDPKLKAAIKTFRTHIAMAHRNSRKEAELETIYDKYRDYRHLNLLDTLKLKIIKFRSQQEENILQSEEYQKNLAHARNLLMSSVKPSYYQEYELRLINDGIKNAQRDNPQNPLN